MPATIEIEMAGSRRHGDSAGLPLGSLGQQSARAAEAAAEERQWTFA